LNGFNDAFFGTESSRIHSSHAYLANWSDFSYHYNDALNGVAPPAPVVLPLLPFTSLLFNDLRMAAHVTTDKAKRFYEELPAREVTRYVDAKRQRHELLRENLRFMAGYFVNRNEQAFLSYLQPHPLQYRELLKYAKGGPTEAELVTQSIRRLARHDPAEYEKRITAMFDAYGRHYKALSEEYSIYKNIHFADLRAVLADLAEPAYIDIIHYSAAAQRRLAERIAGDLSELSLMRGRLVR
jgi:lysophospholipase L1-like esterase